MQYLTEVEGGLPGCLVPRRQRVAGERDPYFPSEACRQLLLKSVSERCCTLPVICGWRTDLVLENRVRNHHLAANYTNLLAAKDYQKEFHSFQQELQQVQNNVSKLEGQLAKARAGTYSQKSVCCDFVE